MVGLEKLKSNGGLARGIFNDIMSAYALDKIGELPNGIEYFEAVKDNFRELKGKDPSLANSLSIFYDTLRGESR